MPRWGKTSSRPGRAEAAQGPVSARALGAALVLHLAALAVALASPPDEEPPPFGEIGSSVAVNLVSGPAAAGATPSGASSPVARPSMASMAQRFTQTASAGAAPAPAGGTTSTLADLLGPSAPTASPSAGAASGGTIDADPYAAAGVSPEAAWRQLQMRNTVQAQLDACPWPRPMAQPVRLVIQLDATGRLARPPRSMEVSPANAALRQQASAAIEKVISCAPFPGQMAREYQVVLR